MLNGEVIWHAINSSLSEELLGLGKETNTLKEREKDKYKQIERKKERQQQDTRYTILKQKGGFSREMCKFPFPCFAGTSTYLE